MTNFIFDVDGTLTEPRKPIDEDFKQELIDLSKANNLYLATGSDYAKTIDQLGEDFVSKYITYSFNCSGNSVWKSGELVSMNEWLMPIECVDWLIQAVERSNFPLKAGGHIEARTGMVNCSIAGRNANSQVRAAFVEYYKEHGERVSLANQFNETFSDKYSISAQIAGSTGLDIFPAGKDKSQILELFEDIPVYFFGDDTQQGGNDHSLSEAIKARQLPEDRVVPVTGPEHTRAVVSLLSYLSC